MQLPGIALRRHPCIVSSMRSRNTSGTRSPLLARDGLKFRVRQGAALWVAHKHSRASVPAQNSVVVSMRPESFSSLVVFHGLPQSVKSVRMATKRVLAKVRVSLAFPNEPSVVGALVLTLNAGKHLFRRLHRNAAVKLIGSRKQERNERLLMRRQNRQNVQANAFDEAQFGQQPITFGFLESLRNSLVRDGFEIKAHNYLLAGASAEHTEQFRHGIEESVHHALLQRNNGIIRDGNAFGTDLGTAFCDVAQPDAVLFSQSRDASLYVEWIHFESGHVDQKARADKLVVHAMIAQHVADVLAQKTLNAFAKLLNAIGILLGHAPGSVGPIGRTRLEFGDTFLHAVIPRHIGDQILHVGKGLHRLDGHGLLQRKRVQTRHAHELGHSVNFSRARAALAGLAVPSYGEIVGLLGLDPVNGVEHHHSGGYFGGIVLKLSRAFCAAPYSERSRGHHFISSMICLSSSGISGMGSRRICISPAGPLRTTILSELNLSSLPGKSSRKCAPRLSFRSRAALVTISETVSRLFRSMAVCHPGLYSRLPVTPTRSARALNS